MSAARACPLSTRMPLVRPPRPEYPCLVRIMEDSKRPKTRASKRRRLTNSQAASPSPQPSSPQRHSSPDELAAESSPVHPPHRTPSNSIVQRGTPRTDYSSASSQEDSPDELDHTTQHTFFREEYHGSFSKAARQSHGHLRVPSRSRSPPPYSRISTPVATPKPHQERGEATYVPYTQRMLLRGHKKGVAAVRFSPDGKLIASCCGSSFRYLTCLGSG